MAPRFFTLALITAVVVNLIVALPSAAEPAQRGGVVKERSSPDLTGVLGPHPDLTGVWHATGRNYGDLSAMVMKGQEIVLTHYGADRYRKVDQGIGDPGALCLPWGPIRGMIIPHPFAILQNSSVIAVLIESQRTYRPIYMDGRGHPADLKEHPEWMGHSIGKWEGDTLVVDTTGVDNRTWLDTSGFEHSDKLHITERYLKTGPDTIKWDVTFEDPVFFAKPFTAEWIFQRSTGDRIISHSCVEFEHDVKDMVPGILIGGSGKAKEEDGAEVVTPLNRPGGPRP